MRDYISYYYLKEVDFMLTHEELMEKCQELRDAVDALANAMRVNGGIFNLDDHEHYMGNMIYLGNYLWSIYFKNRDNISDEDAEVIIGTIAIASSVEGFASGTMDIAPEDRMFDIQWNKFK